MTNKNTYKNNTRKITHEYHSQRTCSAWRCVASTSPAASTSSGAAAQGCSPRSCRKRINPAVSGVWKVNGV